MNAAGSARWLSYGLLLASTVFAAAGQVFFKLGAANRTALIQFFNPQIVGGGALYFMGAILWVAALSRTPLSVAYPFTALTFVFVYLASAVLFHEHPAPGAIVGVVLVLAGLAAILWSR